MDVAQQMQKKPHTDGLGTQEMQLYIFSILLLLLLLLFWQGGSGVSLLPYVSSSYVMESVTTLYQP